MRRAALACLLLLAGCATSHDRQDIVFGSASWPGGAVYGPKATLIVYLADASGPETPIEVDLQKIDNPVPGAELLAYATDEGMMRSPHYFTLPVPAEKVDSGHDYVLKMVVVDQGHPVLALTDPPLVLTRGHPRQVDVMLHPVGR